MPRSKQSEYVKKEPTLKKQTSKQTSKLAHKISPSVSTAAASAESSANGAKQRSKSVDIRLRSFFCASNQAESYSAAKSSSSKKSLLSPSPPKQTQDDSHLLTTTNKSKLAAAAAANAENRSSCLVTCTTNNLNSNNNANTKNVLRSSQMAHKSFDSLTLFQTEGHYGQLSEYKTNAERTPQLQTAVIDFKQLEKKNEKERARLSEIMAKLEIDLAQAKKDLLEDDLIKSPVGSNDFIKPNYQKAKVLFF